MDAAGLIGWHRAPQGSGRAKPWHATSSVRLSDVVLLGKHSTADGFELRCHNPDGKSCGRQS